MWFGYDPASGLCQMLTPDSSDLGPMLLGGEVLVLWEFYCRKPDAVISCLLFLTPFILVLLFVFLEVT